MKEIEFKAGDKVFSIQDGFQTLKKSGGKQYPLKTKKSIYTSRGRFDLDDENRSLFTIEEAKALGIEVPKKKVEVKFWANIYPDHNADIWSTKEKADECSSKYRIACVEMTGEYFVEDV